MTVYAAIGSQVRTLALAVIHEAIIEVQNWTTQLDTPIDPSSAVEFLCSSDAFELAMGCGITVVDWQCVLLRTVGFQGGSHKYEHREESKTRERKTWMTGRGKKCLKI